MYIYNVTVKLDPSIAREWVTWMKEEHMPELMATGLFSRYQLCRLLEQDDSDGPTYTAQYFCADKEQYDTYIRDYAPLMRERGLAKFGGKFAAFRTVMAVEL